MSTMMISFCGSTFNFVLWLSLFYCIGRLSLTSIDHSPLAALTVFVVLITFSLHKVIAPLSSPDIFIHAIDSYDWWLLKQSFNIMPYPSDSLSRDRYCMLIEIIIMSLQDYILYYVLFLFVVHITCGIELAFSPAQSCKDWVLGYNRRLGTSKVAKLEGNDTCPHLIASTIYDTKLVHYLSTVLGKVGWVVKKKPVYNADSSQSEQLRFLRLNQIDMYNYDIESIDLTNQLHGFCYINILWLQNRKQ